MWSDDENEMQEYNTLLSRPSAVSGNRAPDVANLHANKFSRVHIGDKYVTQNVYNTKFVRGSRLVLKPERPTLKSRVIRCSITIFVNAAFVITSSLAIYLFFLTFAKEPVRLDIDLDEFWYLRRADWQALPHDTFELLKLPVKYVILGYSDEKDCNDIYVCRNIVWDKQITTMLKESEDIGPNYLISFNGFVFEGRGANVIGSMVKLYDRNSISVMFFGVCEGIVLETFLHLNELLMQLERLNVLDRNYTILGHCQNQHSTTKPICFLNSAITGHCPICYPHEIIPACYNRSVLCSHWNDLSSHWCYRTVEQIENAGLIQLSKNLNRNKK